MDKRKEITLHENFHGKYIYPDIEKFKNLIKKYTESNEKIGRERVTATVLAKLANMDKEMFRKILNTQKITKKRDCIILICILLKMDEEVTNEALAYYGMSKLNPYLDERDSELLDIICECASEDFPINRRLNINEIDKRLLQGGFPVLDVTNSRKSQQAYLESPYKILKKAERTIAGEIHFGDQNNSLSSEYGFERYQCRASMILENEKNKRRYFLDASPEGEYWLEEFDAQKNSVLAFKKYKDTEDAGVFKDFFLELKRNAKKEQRYMDNLLNDTRNYGERISAKIKNDSIYIFFEKYNYVIPERNEYYLMEYVEGKCCLSVYSKSVFMNRYLSEEKYNIHYGQCDAIALETYESIDEIINMLEDKSLNDDRKSILRCRKKAYQKMSKAVLQCLNDLCDRVIFIQNFDWIFDVPYDVFKWYKIEKEFKCSYDEEEGNICECVDVAEIECFEGKKVLISFDEIKRAFELGFSDIEQICRVKLRKGSVEATLI